ncbi:MAG: FAD-binding oxidoreductase, partial [Vulcanisaeta sp.]
MEPSNLLGFINEVKNALGNNIFVSDNEVSAFSRDWWSLLILRELRGSVIEKPPVVIRPSNMDELGTIIRLANKYGICLVPFGGGSSVVGGSYHSGCVVIDMGKLNKIIDFNEEDLIITVEAGAKVINVEKWLNERGYTLDFHPQSFNLLTVGGAIGHGSTGSHSA